MAKLPKHSKDVTIADIEEGISLTEKTIADPEATPKEKATARKTRATLQKCLKVLQKEKDGETKHAAVAGGKTAEISRVGNRLITRNRENASEKADRLFRDKYGI